MLAPSSIHCNSHCRGSFLGIWEATSCGITRIQTNIMQLEGISHIRALGWQSQAIDQNIKSLDISQGPNYIMQAIQQWLTLVLDLLVAGLAVLVVSLAIAFKSSTSAGQIGIALTVILTISQSLVWLLMSWTQLETSLGAISRIKTLEETLLPEDKDGEDFVPSPGWPDRGAVEFKDVVAAYKYAIIISCASFQISNDTDFEQSRNDCVERYLCKDINGAESRNLRSNWKVSSSPITASQHTEPQLLAENPRCCSRCCASLS